MRAAVLGYPIAHSLSPVLHRAAYAAMGLDGWKYEAIECREEELPSMLGTFGEGWAGLSLTMPLKQAVLPLLDVVSPLAARVGAANTVIFGDGRRRGENTDVHGIVHALGEAGVRPSSALILGGGATARSALAALRELGLRSSGVAVRRAAGAGGTVEAGERIGIAVEIRALDEPFPGTDLIISTLPPGTADAYAASVAAAAGSALDVVYAPWPTPLARAVRDAGGTAVGGFPMLLHQAAKQVELMTGRPAAPVEEMRAAGERALRVRGRRVERADGRDS